MLQFGCLLIRVHGREMQGHKVGQRARNRLVLTPRVVLLRWAARASMLRWAVFLCALAVSCAQNCSRDKLLQHVVHAGAQDLRRYTLLCCWKLPLFLLTDSFLSSVGGRTIPGDLGLQKMGRPGFKKAPLIRSERVSQPPLLTSHPHLSLVCGWLGPAYSSQQVPSVTVHGTKPLP